MNDMDPMGPQIGLPGSYSLHKRMLAESGLELRITLAAGLAIAQGIGTVIGGISKKNSQDRAADAQNEYNKRKYAYDMEAWGMDRARLDAKYEHAYSQWEIDTRNWKARAESQDAAALGKHQYDLSIRNYQQEQLERQYQKSEEIYGDQLDFNRTAQKHALDSERLKHWERRQELAAESEDNILQAAAERGKLEAAGLMGDTVQSSIAAAGRAENRIAESLLSANRSMYFAVRDIALDKYASDLRAQASRMIEPGVLPIPPEPTPTIIPELQAPRALDPDYSYGPKPIMGVAAQGGSMLDVIGAGIKGAVGGAEVYKKFA